MTIDQIRAALQKAGLSLKSEERLANGTGTQLRLQNGAIVNCFDNENYNVQGKHKDAVERALASGTTGILRATQGAAPSSKVFVVYGHDLDARHQLEATLRR